VDLQVSFMHRHFEEVVLARELLAEGALGALHTVRVRNATPGPDWGDWFFDPNQGPGGVVLQLGVHGIDLAAWLLGPIRDVSARMATLQPTRRLADGRIVEVSAGVPDTALASYAFASGVFGTHEMSLIEAQGCDRFRLELYGEAGTLWLRSERGRLALWAPQRKAAAWWVPELDNAPLGQRHHRSWLDGLTGRAPRGNTVEEAITGMQVVQAIGRSARAGATVTPVRDSSAP
jgi:myo-inositol 2-dehydrogenase/D-chiro-inositol 1-dehydrogenase